MTAIALLPGEVVAPATSLPDAATAAAVAELTLALGCAPAPSELGGLVRRGDGRTWLLAHRVPALSRAELGELADRPWAHLGPGMRFQTLLGPIAEVAAILRDPSSDHAEVLRRERLHEAMLRDRHEVEQRRLAEQRITQAAEAAERARKLQSERDYDLHGWGALPPVAKLAFWLALAVDDKKLADELRRLGEILGRTNTLPFPYRKWR